MKKTIMIIDNKATAEKPYEVYEIDRYEYQTIENLRELVGDCMNKEVYSIKIMEDDNELMMVRNWR